MNSRLTMISKSLNQPCSILRVKSLVTATHYSKRDLLASWDALTELNDDMNNGLYPADLTEKNIVTQEQLKAMTTEYTESGCHGFNAG